MVEYAVHGWWGMHASDENGRGGAWWVTLRELLLHLDEEGDLFVQPGRPEILEAIEAFERKLVDDRKEQWAAIMAEEADQS